MVIIDIVVNTLFGGLTLDPAGMHCPSWDDAFVSSLYLERSLHACEGELRSLDVCPLTLISQVVCVLVGEIV